MLRDKKKKMMESVTEKVPCLLRRNQSAACENCHEPVTINKPHFDDVGNYCSNCCDHLHQDSHPKGSSHCRDDGLLNDLGANASISYSIVQSKGPPSRPLEFPAPTVDRAITVSADVVNHKNGQTFRATSLLMRRPNHAKNCAARLAMSPTSDNSLQNNNGHTRTNSRDSVHSWHSPFYTQTTPVTPTSTLPQRFHRRTQSNPTQNKQPCGLGCDLPERAYCVRRKICDTLYGSIRLCVVLRRVSRVMGTMMHTQAENGLDWVHGRRGHWTFDGSVGRPGESAWETTEQLVAIKVVNWTKVQSLRGRHLEDPIKELAAMQLLGSYHPHISSISDSLQDENHLFCVLPYFSGGDLYGRLWDEMRISPTGRIEEAQARKWFRQMLSGLSHLQKKGVCHRDLCMENLLVDERDNIRIIDFGLCLRVPFADPNNRNLVTDVSANTFRRLMKSQGQGGKWPYMAPEVAKRHHSFDGFAVDLWAAGVVLFVLLVGKHPFPVPDAVDPIFRRVSIDGDLAGLFRDRRVPLSNTAIDLLQNMLWCDPSKRLTLAEIVDHPWVNWGYKVNKKLPKCQYAEETVNLKWFIENNPINDRGSNFLLPNRLRLDSGSSSSTVGSMTYPSLRDEPIQQKQSTGGGDDITAAPSEDESLISNSDDYKTRSLNREISKMPPFFESKISSSPSSPQTLACGSVPYHSSDENLDVSCEGNTSSTESAREELSDTTKTKEFRDMIEKKKKYSLPSYFTRKRWLPGVKSGSGSHSDSETEVGTGGSTKSGHIC